MKKFLSLICLICYILTLSVSAQGIVMFDKTNPFTGDGVSVKMVAADKIQFANEKDVLAAQRNLNDCTRSTNQQEQIDLLILQAASSSGEERERIINELESYGVYRYPTEVINRPTSRSQNSDVVINAPDIYYTTGDQTWTVATGGYWRNENWKKDVTITSIGGNVGGVDGFGVGYSNTGGTYKTYVVRNTGAINNGKTGAEHEGIITSNRSDGDGKLGFGFQMQDTFGYSENSGPIQYIGSGWAGSATYSRDFGYYSGIATSYYVHTWDDAKLNSVSFTVGDSNTISFDISFKESSFKAYGSDTRFQINMKIVE